MYIPNDEWDLIVSECLELARLVEETPKIIVYPNRKEILTLLYIIIHSEDKPIPRKRSKKKRLLKRVKSLSLT